MPSRITAYRVLIEMPDDLGEESCVFSKTVHKYNESDAIPRDVLFVPVGWDIGVDPERGDRLRLRRIRLCRMATGGVPMAFVGAAWGIGVSKSKRAEKF